MDHGVLSGEEVKTKAYRRHVFPQRYKRDDVNLLAAVDTAHETLSGPATQERVNGVHHSNAVDQLTQWEALGVTSQISEA